MKKLIFSLMLISNLVFLFSEEYEMKKLYDYTNGDESSFIYRRNEEDVAPQDDNTGNKLSISMDGRIFVYNVDNSVLTDITDYDKPKLIVEFNKERISRTINIYNDFFTVSGYLELIIGYDFNSNKLFQVDVASILKNNSFDYTYYDKETHILLFKEYNGGVHCIVQPSLIQEQNAENYKNPKETLVFLENNNYGSHISIDENNNLVIDGRITPWGTIWYGNFRYQIVDNYFVNVWNGKSTKIKFENKKGEIVESTVIHPCGDIYRLIYNEKTKVHTLYYVQNTWDPSWRKEWYSTHK